MIVWRGRGIVVLLAILVFVIVETMVDGANGPGYYATHGWPKIIAGILAAVPLWFIGKSFENDGRGDHLWFVPVKFWAPIILVAGFVMASSSSAPPAQAVEPAREAESAPAPEPVRTPYYAPVRQPVVHASVVPSVPVAQPLTQIPVIQQVYADNRTHTYYREDCKARPENAYRIPKSLAVSQGYKPAKECA